MESRPGVYLLPVVFPPITVLIVVFFLSGIWLPAENPDRHYGTAGKIVINEFMYDPPTGLPEYVELYNRSGKPADIDDWRLADAVGSRRIADKPTVIPPDSFVVLSADTSALFHNFGPALYIEMSGNAFPSLNNGGDVIRVLNEHQETVDALTYTPGWGGQEVALERRDPNALSTARENWGEAPGGGSPGRRNRVAPDTTAPALEEVAIANPSTLRLTFDETLRAGNASDPSHISLNPVAPITRIVHRSDTLVLHLTEGLFPEITYTLTIEGLEDIFGNPMEPVSREFRYLLFSAADSFDVVFNEILFNQTPGHPEFVELHNPTNKHYELTGWIFGDGTESTTLPTGTRLEAEHYLVLTGNPGNYQGTGQVVYLPGFPNLNNRGDRLFLRSSGGRLIDSLAYRDDWGDYDMEAGISLERRDPGAASNDPDNWRSSLSETGHSAGHPNPAYRPDTVPPRLVFAALRPQGRVKVLFNEFVDPRPGARFLVNTAPVPVREFELFRGNRVLLQAPSEIQPGQAPSPRLVVRGIKDVKGNEAYTQEIPVASAPGPGDLAINEIMYWPIQDPGDFRPDQSEYVEIINTRKYALSLEEIYLRDTRDENGKSKRLVSVSSTGKWLNAGRTALFYPEERPGVDRSRFARAFDLAGQLDKWDPLLRVEKQSLSLPSESGIVILCDSTGRRLDSVQYRESWHNPNIIDTKGISLERVYPQGDSNNETNWSSSASALGGTPLARNTLYQHAVDINTGPAGQIILTPNPFSPDGDGYQDHLFIRYTLDATDYLLRIRIYDRYGRLVRNLADGKPAGRTGTIIWDGLRDDRTHNRIGIYIIIFEAYDSSTGGNRAFKEVAVLVG